MYEKHTVWEKLGASLGLWAAAVLAAQAWFLTRTTADPAGADAAFAAALLGERATWEAMTFLRIVAGLQLAWWGASLATRLRAAEGPDGRLASVAFLGLAVWGAVWLASALFNSAAILFAADYANPAGARMAATLALETPYVLTPAVAFAFTWAVALAVLRFGGLPRWYGWGTLAASAAFLALAIADWYGPGTLSALIVGLALAWTALTSVLLIVAHGDARAAAPRATTA